MKNILIAIVIIILAVGSYLFFQPKKKAAPQPPVVPTEAQPSSDFKDYLTEEELLHHRQIELELKRAQVYAGNMTILPPCPRDTHEDEGFCRKGASKYDTNIPYIGSKTFDLDASCRPDQCESQCKKACEDAAGEECALINDIRNECLRDFPPEKEALDVIELREQGIQCLSQYRSHYQHYRCTYNTNEDEQFRYARIASDEECRQLYDAYQECRDALPQKELTTATANASSEDEMRCTKIINDEFSPARCVVAWHEADQRPYGKAEPERVICSYQCN